MDVLADTGLVFALVNARHALHPRVCNWLNARPAGFRLLVCRQVQMALLRLLCDTAAMDGDPLTLPEAWKVYADLVRDPGMGFFAEPDGFQALWVRLCAPHGASPKVLSDAYLAALALTAGIPLATFDRDFGKFHGLPVMAVD